MLITGMKYYGYYNLHRSNVLYRKNKSDYWKELELMYAAAADWLYSMMIDYIQWWLMIVVIDDWW